MRIVNMGFGKVITRGKKRFFKLPVPVRRGLYNFPVIANRAPFPSAVYAKPKDAWAYMRKFVPSPKKSSPEANCLFRMMMNSLLKTRLIFNKPLELPYYLTGDDLGRLACLKVEEGPAVLVLCRPEDITRVLGELSIRFGKITYRDDRGFMNFTIQPYKGKL